MGPVCFHERVPRSRAPRFNAAPLSTFFEIWFLTYYKNQRSRGRAPMLALFACLALLGSTGAAAHGPPLDLTRPNSADARHSAGRALATPPAAADARATAGAEAFSLHDADAVTEDEDDYAMLELESLEQENRYADGRACVGVGGMVAEAAVVLRPRLLRRLYSFPFASSFPSRFSHPQSSSVLLEHVLGWRDTAHTCHILHHLPGSDAEHARAGISRQILPLASSLLLRSSLCFFPVDSECLSLWELTLESLA